MATRARCCCRWQLTIPEGFSARTLDVKLRADWLVCKEICIPESGEFSLELPADTATASHASLFTAARTRVPHLPMNVRATARVDGKALAVRVDGLLPDARQRELNF